MQRFNMFGPEFKSNPYPTYERMRAEQPLFALPLGETTKTLWYVTRYADVEACLRNHRDFVKDMRNTMTPAELAQLPEVPAPVRLLSNHMVNVDAPDHTRLRALVSKAFNAHQVEKLAPQIQVIANTIIDEVGARGHMDLIDDYALPLPIAVITNMLGIPNADTRRFHAWSHAFVVSPATVQRSEKKLSRAGRMIEDFTSYMRDLIAERRCHPREDLITALIEVEEAGDRLTEEELFSMIILLVVSGHETVANTIGNGVLALLQNPAQMALLQKHPELMPSAVEEIMRFDGSMERATMRFAARDLSIGGQTIRRGDAVSLVLGAANRDPEVYNEPDTFNICRYRDGKSKRHMGLGLGVHYCLGAQLGRIEVAIAIETLLRRLPGLRLNIEPKDIQWRSIPVVRSMVHLPVRW